MKHIVPLRNSISTDTLQQDIYSFDDQGAPLAENNGIHKLGGITNILEKETNFPEAGEYAFAENGQLISVVNNGDETATLKADGNSVGLISPYGVASKTEIQNVDDVALTADGTYITCSLNINVITVREFDLANVQQNQRQITFTNLSEVIQFFTSISIIRYDGMHYADSLEFALRLGDQVVILKESDPTISISRALQSTAVLGGNTINAVIVYNGILVVAGAGGRLGSYDGTNWRNYDGTGTGTGINNNATVLGSNAILCMLEFNGFLVVAGAGGRLGSFRGAWRNYDGTGSTIGYYSNATVLGSNDINCLGQVVKSGVAYLVAGGVAGRIGSFNVTGTEYPYTHGVTSVVAGTTNLPPSSNALAIGVSDVKAMTTITQADGTQQLVVGGANGRLASWDGGWRLYTGSTSPTPVEGGTTWSGRTAATPSGGAGGGWISVCYGNKLFVAVGQGAGTTSGAVMTSPDGVNWTPRVHAAASGTGWRAVTFGTPGGTPLFVAVARSTSISGAVMTSPDGITWTARTAPASTGNGWISVCYGTPSGNPLFVAIAETTATSGAIMTSPDGITWTARTSNAGAGSGWQSVCYGGTRFVAVSRTTAVTGAVQTSDDGITWTARTSVGGTGSGWRAVTWNTLTGYIACSETTSTTGAIMQSNDGITWNSKTSIANTSGGWIGLASGEGLVVALGGIGTTGVLQTSPDGTTWTNRTTPLPAAGYFSATYGDGVFVGIAYGPGATNVITSVQVNQIILDDNATIVGNETITALATVDNTTVVVASAGGRVGNIVRKTTPITYTKRTYTGAGFGPQLFSNAAVLGAVGINSIKPYGMTLVFSGVASRIGSWDGSNWKNYDGTGTGTGIYNGGTAIGPTNAITSATEYQGLFIVTGASIVQSIGPTGAVSQFYNELATGAPVSNLLAGMATSSYLYVYRYENGNYLINLINNSLNKLYVLDDINKLVATNRGRYAVPQFRDGVTRHVVTESPRYDAANAYAVSTVGYTDFATFQAYQIYPNTGLVSSSAIGLAQIGFGYADALITNGGNVFELYSPQPLTQPSAFYMTYVANTNTLVNGHGKLTNLFGGPSTKPFEIRVNWINGVQSYLSVAAVDQYATDALGVMITNAGEFDESYQPQIVDDSTIMYKYGNSWIVLKITDAPANRIQSIDGRFYKINTISPLNLWDSVNNSLIVSSMDYNGKMFFSSGSAPTATATLVASVAQTGFSNSVDVGEKLVNILNPTFANIEVFAYRLPITGALQPNYMIDTYVAGSYSFSTLTDGNEFIKPDPASPIYVPDTRIPVAIGSAYNSGTAQSGSTTVFLNSKYDGYEIGNDVTGLYVPFALFGQVYLFDGVNIYTANIQNNLLLSQELICNALGMQFIATTPTIAYFLSSFDNSLYGFQGGRNLVKAQAFTNLETIIKGSYSTLDNTLALDTANMIIWIRDGIVTKQDKKASQTNLQYYPTSGGLIIANNTSAWQYTYYPLSGSTVVPLIMQTAYHGLLANEKSILKEWVVTLYNDRRDAVRVTFTEKSKDQDAQYQNRTDIQLNSINWDSAGYAFLRVIPKYPRSLGSSLQVQLLEKAYILEISAEYEDGSKAVISQSKTR